MIDDQRQALPGERDSRAGDRTSVPRLHVDAAVARGDHGREAVLQRLVLTAADRGAVAAVSVDEAAVERRQQAPALAVRHLHRAAHRRTRRLVPAGIEGDRGPRVVEPRHIRDDPRIVGLGAEGRQQHGRPTPDDRTRAAPLALAGKGMGEDRLDAPGPHGRKTAWRRCPRARRPAGRRRSDADGRQLRQLRPALLRRLPGVVVVLDLVDEPVAVVRPQPFDSAGPERQARGPQHRRHVRVDDRRQHHDDGEREDPASTPPPPLPSPAVEPCRSLGRTGRFQATDARPAT